MILMKTLQLNKGRESSLLRRHPWIFSGAIDRVNGNPAPGETIRVNDATGKSLGVAGYSPTSQIRARMWSFAQDEVVDESFFLRRLREAVARRQGMLNDPQRTGCRLVYGESDDLPGLIVDRYGDFLVCQFLFAGVEKWKHVIVEHLRALVPCAGIYERSEAAVRAREGLDPAQGGLWGETPPELVEINEQDRRYALSIAHGHKTGFYLDQYDNRELVRQLSQGRSVLNCFAYTGGFGIAALQGGATHVLNVDSSAPSLELAAENFRRNGFEAGQYTNNNANVFEILREFKQTQRSFDLIVLDPPKFAETKAQFKRAARAYKDIALQAAALMNPGGLLVTFSCSGAIDLPLFQKITADAVLDAGRRGQIQHYMHQSADHPVGLPFPESLYLKGLVCRLD
ncbi:MAG: class I SAM-dependent methyltransferase [Gammaproteobacteria bacterium]|nr:class I SAM-dependent methyltransferase [Gammaproteobacteria bacterium]